MISSGYATSGPFYAKRGTIPSDGVTMGADAGARFVQDLHILEVRSLTARSCFWLEGLGMPLNVAIAAFWPVVCHFYSPCRRL